MVVERSYLMVGLTGEIIVLGVHLPERKMLERNEEKENLSWLKFAIVE